MFFKKVELDFFWNEESKHENIVILHLRSLIWPVPWWEATVFSTTSSVNNILNF
jgi:hypothetical protein